MIESIGLWVLHTACQQLAAWLAAGLPPVRMAVNLSPRQLASADPVKQVQAALHASQIPLSYWSWRSQKARSWCMGLLQRRF
ncbi:EAL domain-containing protein (putative c-di-GMP-specific phosphodiesterase class I) [Rhodanobacter sp. MP7CTX1]|nr:EAL domain-containing protein (putative c-di-GMP-specific phosphodiesterase class I) [Rhodanobacter sp. MP7CTX1]